jgi:addiction module HigA family antidote
MNTSHPIEDFTTAPSETLLECIEALGMSQVELAAGTGLDEQTINLIIQGIAPITHQAALAFEEVLRVPAHFWLNMETNYRERLRMSRRVASGNGRRHG